MAQGRGQEKGQGSLPGRPAACRRARCGVCFSAAELLKSSTLHLQKDSVEKDKETFSHAGAGPDPDSGPLDLAYLNLVKLKPGTMVNGRYRLEALIGQGGFGIVFEALDETLNSRVAVKFLNPRLTGNEKKFLRVQREINLSRKISDERIIKTFSLESWREIHFLVMELARGRSLKSVLEEKGCFAWPEFKGIYLDILEAVAVLHRNGIVHRDLKPANILIDGRQRVKILDFGLAKEVEDTAKTSTVGEIVGSPYYMSPEQIRGGAIGFPSDVYQLGLVLYRTLSGRHPFEHTSTMEVIFKQLNLRPDLSTPALNGLPRFLRFGLHKSLEKSPPRRFADAGAMASFFSVGKVSLWKRVYSAFRRGRLKWVLGALAVAAASFLAYQATLGSRAVHSLRNEGSRLEARNRFGVRLWMKDFAPLTVYQAYQTRSIAPIVPLAGFQSENMQLRLGDKKAVMVFLTQPPDTVFSPGLSIASSVPGNQRAILDQRGKVLSREPFPQEYEYEAYDYTKNFKLHAIKSLAANPKGESESLITLQQFQSMYPAVMIFLQGIKKYVYTNPGTFGITPLENGNSRVSFMLFGINNLAAHMLFVAEIGFDTSRDQDELIRGIPNANLDERYNIQQQNLLVFLPGQALLLENRWREKGSARFSDSANGDILEVTRDGRITVQKKNGSFSYADSPGILRRVYTLVNSSYQEKVKNRNLGKALELILQAAAFPLQNPYLRSTLLFLQGDLEVGLGNFAAGEKTLKKALEFYQGNSDAKQRLCEIDFLKGDPLASFNKFASMYSGGQNFWGFSSFGAQLFRGYVFLQAGMFSQAADEFEKITPTNQSVAQFSRTMVDLFKGDYTAALVKLRALEMQPLGTVDLRELRLMIGRSMLLNDSDPTRAKFLFADIFRNSLAYGHLAELSDCFYLCRDGHGDEAAKMARMAFDNLARTARGDFMTRLWLFYDAYVFARTMELAGDSGGAALGYRACVEANPHAELAARSRQRLKLLSKPR
jgi:serine/threonine protein kinase/tetratricopeptide (TPR) repeat protein